MNGRTPCVEKRTAGLTVCFRNFSICRVIKLWNSDARCWGVAELVPMSDTGDTVITVVLWMLKVAL